MQRVPEVIHAVQVAELAPAVPTDVQRHHVHGGHGGSPAPDRPTPGALRPAREHLVLGAARVELREELRWLASELPQAIDSAVKERLRASMSPRNPSWK